MSRDVFMDIFWEGMTPTEQAEKLIEVMDVDNLRFCGESGVHDHLKHIPLTWEFLATFSFNLHGILKSDEALEKAMAKLAKDPKQKALKEIEAHYQSVKNQFKRRGFSAQFIREMHTKYPEITAIKTIENLVSELNSKNADLPR